MGVELHIEELVLHGFASADRHRIAEAMRMELARLVSAAGQVEALKNQPTLERGCGGNIDGETIHIQAGEKPEAAGTRIARAVFGTMRPQSGVTSRAAGTNPAREGKKP
jgi:hypothetical protein